MASVYARGVEQRDAADEGRLGGVRPSPDIRCVADGSPAMLNLGLWSGGIMLLLLILNLAQTTGRPSGSVFRRSWSGSFAEGLAKGVQEAILEVQAIEQPEKRYSRNEHKATRIFADDSGGPDDPGKASRRVQSSKAGPQTSSKGSHAEGEE